MREDSNRCPAYRLRQVSPNGPSAPQETLDNTCQAIDIKCLRACPSVIRCRGETRFTMLWNSCAFNTVMYPKRIRSLEDRHLWLCYVQSAVTSPIKVSRCPRWFTFLPNLEAGGIQHYDYKTTLCLSLVVSMGINMHEATKKNDTNDLILQI